MNTEPVAWINLERWRDTSSYLEDCVADMKLESAGIVIPLYTHPHPDNLGLAESIIKQQELQIEALKAHPVKEQYKFGVDWSKDGNAVTVLKICEDGVAEVVFMDYQEATHPVKELTDEEINVVAILQDAEIVPVGHEIWKTGEEFNKYKRIVLATAKALRKAQER